MAATHVPHVIHTTVALLLVLLILGFSIRWGWMESLAGSLAGGLAFDYFFLPPRGFGLEAPEHWVALGSFLVTAIVTGQLAARASRYRIEAENRRDEIARLYRLGDAVLNAGTAELSLERVVQEIVGIFCVRAAALFDKQSGQIFLSGTDIAEDLLREVAATGNPKVGRTAGFCTVPVRQSGSLAGSLAIVGNLSQSAVEALSLIHI